jgi:hypothetical protein
MCGDAYKGTDKAGLLVRFDEGSHKVCKKVHAKRSGLPDWESRYKSLGFFFSAWQ